MRRATIEDVAARAGVTKSTVSHALSGKRPVSPETRNRINHAVAELGYQPHSAAQRLANGRSRMIGFVYPLYTPQITGLEMKFITGAATVVNQASYAFMLLTHPDRRPDNLLHFVQSGLMDGVILMQVRLHDPRVEILTGAGLPFVLVGRCIDNTGLHYVDVDVDAAIDQAVDYLVGLGHRSLAYLHQNDPDFGFAARALAAYGAACERHGLPSLTRTCAVSVASGQSAMKALLTLHPEITGVIAWTDRAAWGAYHAAQELGRRVPEDLSIVGFDASDAPGLVARNLTSVEIDSEAMTARAAGMLIAMLEDKPIPEQQVLLPPKFVIGDTTAPPNSGAWRRSGF